MIRVLDVGCGSGTNSHWFSGRGELDVVRLDGDPANSPDVVHDITNPFPDNLIGAFDIVLASHVIEHMRFRYIQQAVKNIVNAAKPGGEVWVLVPDMTWACQQFLAGHETFGLLGTIWGGQADDWDYHYCGFSKKSLAILMYNCGCKDVKIKQDNIVIMIDGKHYDVKQLTAMGIRA